MRLATAGLSLYLCVVGTLVEAQGQTTIDLEPNRDALLGSLSDHVSSTLDPNERLPILVARLTLDGTMRFYPSTSGQTEVVQIDVTNVGLSPASEPNIAVSMMGLTFAGALYQYFGGTATSPNTVNGNERGYIRIEVARGGLSECASHEMSVALAQKKTLKATVATQCPLRWTTPIDAQRLGSAPDPMIVGKTLQDIVSSRVQGSPKGFCSNCHNRDAGEPPYYRPNIARGATTLIEPFDLIGHQIGSPDGVVSWAFGGTTSGGSYYSWAEWFISRDDKPQALKDAFSKWLADGSLH